MAKLTINRGTNANDGTGDNLRAGANKVNLNFDEIYTAIGNGTTIDGTIKIADDSSTVATISANGETLKILGGNAINSVLSGNTLTISADAASLLTASGSATITNKTIDLTDNTLSGTFAEVNTMVSDATLVDTASSQSLTNKNLTGAGNTFPTLSIKDDASTIDTVSLGQTLTFEGGSGITTTVTDNKVSFATDGSIVTETSTDTLTNKTISGASNTITNISAANVTGAFDNTSSGSKIRFNFANVGSFPSETTYEGMFAYDTGGNQAYVADSGGWTKLINENASVGDLSNVNITGVANGQALIWSSAQGRFNPGDVSVSTSTYEDTAVRFDVSANGSSAYRFGHYGSTDNPTIYAKQGQTIAFDLTSLSNAHPFVLQTSSGSTYVSGNRITTGLTHVATDGTVTTGVNAQGKTSGVLYFEVPSDQITIYYICSSHGAMNGTLYIRQKIPSVQKYTGNGSTTAYTVTAGKVVDDMLVFVNGICLVPTDDYTISGTTLTMATAPANTAEITIRYL
jgi:hypothetical protein